MNQLPIVSNPFYSYAFSTKHRFPMQKFRFLLENLQEKGIVNRNNLIRPGRARDDVLQLAHCPIYLRKFTQGLLSAVEVRRLGLPWSEGLVKRTLISPNGTLLTANLALEHGIACHLAGGTHHAHYNFASGYCILNDLAIASLALLRQGKVKRVLIFDCDVHQGDGTAKILTDEPNIFTCSVHCEKNFPYRKATSDLDINLAAGTNDDAYLVAVSDALDQALQMSQPDLVIYDAGVDVFVGDPLGLLDVSMQGIRARDALVLDRLSEKQIPVATVIGGGYDKDEKKLASRHAIVTEEASRCFIKVRAY